MADKGKGNLLEVYDDLSLEGRKSKNGEYIKNGIAGGLEKNSKDQGKGDKCGQKKD